MKKILFYLDLLMRVLLYEVTYTAKTEGTVDFRLPEDIYPVKYDLVIFTDLYSRTPQYWGDVRVQVKCVRATSKIILNSENLLIMKHKVKVSLVTDVSSDQNIQISEQKFERENNQYIIILKNELRIDEMYEVLIPFRKVLKNDESGYFIQSYWPSDGGNEKWLTLTHFGTISAREAFPCFDQINLKAKFKISLAHHETVVGFSNMKRAETHPIAEKISWIMDEFEESEPMSTYCVSIALGAFASKKLTTSLSEVLLQIWADESDIDRLRLASSMVVHAFDFYSEFFKIQYALEKLDILVVPDYHIWNDEKFGLIMLNAESISEPENAELSNFERKSEVVLDVCHAVCQQWIGTYVTMSWWNEYWFHEALILYLDILCAEEAFPKWKYEVFEQRAISSFIHVLMWDAEATSTPLLRQTDSFDIGVRYISMESLGKAFHLVQTMNFFLGDLVFRKSITNYMKRYKFKNSNIDQVWDVFNETANEAGILPPHISVKQIMDTWITQRGYPLITVRRDTQNKIVTLQQERYFLSEEEKESTDENACWIIPLSFITRKSDQFEEAEVHLRDWLTCSERRKIINLELENDEWILFHLQLDVLSRINYDDENWKLLQASLLKKDEYTKIDVATRTRLISDMFELSKTGRLHYQIVFETIKYMDHEEFHSPWKEAMENLDKIRRQLFGTVIVEPFQKYVGRILETVFDKPEFKQIDKLPVNDPMKLQKTSVVAYSCIFGVHSCREQSQILFEKWYWSGQANKHILIPGNIRKIVLCEGIKNGDRSQWNFLSNQYHVDNESSLNSDILEALGCSMNREILRSYLIWSVKSDQISIEDSIIVFGSMFYNEIAYKLTKEFFFEYFNDIKIFHNGSTHALRAYVEKLIEATLMPNHLNDLKEFINSKKEDLGDSLASIEQSIIKANRNVLWRKKYYEIFLKLFSE